MLGGEFIPLKSVNHIIQRTVCSAQVEEQGYLRSGCNKKIANIFFENMI